MRARENDAVHFHFHPSIGNYLRSVSGKFVCEKDDNLKQWSLSDLQANGLSDPGNRKRTFHENKNKINEMKLCSLRSESRKPYQRTRVRCFVCKEDEICETNFRYESTHKCSNWWLGSRRRRMRIVKSFFFSEKNPQKSRDLNSSTSINDTGFSAVQMI